MHTHEKALHVKKATATGVPLPYAAQILYFRGRAGYPAT